MTESSPRYAIGDLADLAGVSRRTIRYYVQESLLPPPYGVGRGNHYGPEHLRRILQVKSWQEAGRSLDEIRRALGNPAATLPTHALPQPEPPLHRTAWRRFELAPGVELHVSHDIRLPAPGKLHDLAAWCRLHFPSSSTKEHDDAND